LGGFGNLAGEIDLWDIEAHKELGKTKAYCTVTVEWAKNGKHFMTAVLYERVKVDNELKIFLANGQQILTKTFPDSELYDAHW
jgi:translation initiation factor 2A